MIHDDSKLHAVEPHDDDRVSIPLMMLRGNLEALLENRIEVNSIHLKWYGPEGVVIEINMTPEQKAAALVVGFRTAKVTGDE